MTNWTPPRRIRIDQQTPIEAAIRAALDAVEAGPAHPHMTRATNLLGQALDAVADFVDGVPETPAPHAAPGDENARTLFRVGAFHDGVPCGWAIEYPDDVGVGARMGYFDGSRKHAEAIVRALNLCQSFDPMRSARMSKADAPQAGTSVERGGAANPTPTGSTPVKAPPLKPTRIVVLPEHGSLTLTYGKTYDVIRWDDSDMEPMRYPVVICDLGHEYRLTETRWEAAR